MDSNTQITFTADKLNIIVAENRKLAARHAALSVNRIISKLLTEKKEIRMVFAAAPSQSEFLDELIHSSGIEWNRITAFHTDEYIGLKKDAPQLFGNYLHEHLFSKVNFKSVYKINPETENYEDECSRYSGLINEGPIDIICMGIGDNGHIAFNDPPTADFNDTAIIRVVELDERCRMQQVNDGCFESIDQVPAKAITLTVPALMSAEYLSIVIPGSSKSEAVMNSLKGPVNEACPASILRTHLNARMFLDFDSASMLDYNDFNYEIRNE